MTDGHISANQFEELYLNFKDKFTIIANSYVHDEMVAEDIVSVCFAKFWAERNNIIITGLPEAYIMRSVKNACLNHMRDQANRLKIDKERYAAAMHEIEILQEESVNEIFKKDIEKIFREIMSKTSPLTREIFYSSRFDNLTYQEIAEKLNITPRKVKREIQHVLELTRSLLKDYLPSATIMTIMPTISLMLANFFRQNII